MEMNTTITYDLENASNELTRRMKIMIAWLTKKDAISRLINEGHVREVDIRFSPFWLSRVSSNLDNIEFIIKK
jgi:muramidase (phage lysozyme)